MQRLRGDQKSSESILPRHVLRASSFRSLPAAEVSSSEESSTDSFWSSPKMQPNDDGDNYNLPIWSSKPQSPDNNKVSSTIAVSNNGNAKLVKGHPRRNPALFVGFILIGFVAIVINRATLRRATVQVANFRQHRNEIEDNLKKYENEIYGLEREISTLDYVMHKQLRQHLGLSRPSKHHEREVSEMNELKYRLENEATQADVLKRQVQDMSRSEIIKKYGNKVHLVEMELVFSDGNHAPNTFVIEMAPIEMMPHSVHTFLEMVSNGLIDGCSFIMNALHVVKAAPLPYDGSSAVQKAKEFADKGLESVSFKEYSEDYPHQKYTVGFAADGSPSFYINTADNSEIHVGDPCFGKVISGYDTIQRLASNPTRNGIWFEHRIGIASARIVTR